MAAQMREDEDNWFLDTTKFLDALATQTGKSCREINRSFNLTNLDSARDWPLMESFIEVNAKECTAAADTT